MLQVELLVVSVDRPVPTFVCYVEQISVLDGGLKYAALPDDLGLDVGSRVVLVEEVVVEAHVGEVPAHELHLAVRRVHTDLGVEVVQLVHDFDAVRGHVLLHDAVAHSVARNLHVLHVCADVTQLLAESAADVTFGVDFFDHLEQVLLETDVGLPAVGHAPHLLHCRSISNIGIDAVDALVFLVDEVDCAFRVD
eukprot:CAMPEP_0116914682 /NCGR_PEP_ID=MMETSP0467-20121206/17477_1 /TAXON_ID=283647 /ORGANISM="Mesodinium pulex, Strain SPMC105" /LENGTH=193 /DNA_ID=CAMNT_0004591199 /DNA_START=1129 /DNA_END=1710 /DNA_ORIENTATION=+